MVTIRKPSAENPVSGWSPQEILDRVLYKVLEQGEPSVTAGEAGGLACKYRMASLKTGEMIACAAGHLLPDSNPDLDRNVRITSLSEFTQEFLGHGNITFIASLQRAHDSAAYGSMKTADHIGDEDGQPYVYKPTDRSAEDFVATFAASVQRSFSWLNMGMLDPANRRRAVEEV